MQHDILKDAFIAVTMPLMMLVVLTSIAGGKPSLVAGTYFRLIGLVVRTIFQALAALLGEIIMLVSRYEQLQRLSRNRRTGPGPSSTRQPKSKIFADEEECHAR